MATVNSDKAWKDYGEMNPYFGVITDEEYKGTKLSEKSKSDFFEGGKQYVERVYNLIHKHIDADFETDSILDFGCGTGRLTISFAPKANIVVGLDVSEHMLQEAAENSKEMGYDNIQYYLSDDSLSKVKNQQFGLVNSYIVLQHINVNRGMKIIQELIGKVKPNGVGVLHLTYVCHKGVQQRFFDFFRYRSSLVHGILNVLKGKPFSKPLMQMNSYNLNEVFLLLQKNGIENSHVDFEKHGSCWGVTLVFRKKDIK